MQIDVVKIQEGTVVCNLYTGERCVKVIMTLPDYERLIRDGFFIRDDKQADSAGVLNTTREYDAVVGGIRLEAVPEVTRTLKNLIDYFEWLIKDPNFPAYREAKAALEGVNK